MTQLVISCVGRMKAGPEQELCSRFVERAQKAGRAVGFTKLTVHEIPESRSGSAERRKSDEGGHLLKAVEETGTKLVVFDERGKSPSSRKFAQKIAQMRDAGAQKIIFAIGGPDGHDAELLKRAHEVISFGQLTVPHQLARIMVVEQLYRSICIMTGHPYHRE